MSPFAQAVIGAIIWALANVVYVDMKQKGARGFGRVIAFWLGTPTTFFSLFFVREGRATQVRPPPDDEESLLREVRMDRARRLSARSEADHETGAPPEASPGD